MNPEAFSKEKSLKSFFVHRVSGQSVRRSFENVLAPIYLYAFGHTRSVTGYVNAKPIDGVNLAFFRAQRRHCSAGCAVAFQ